MNLLVFILSLCQCPKVAGECSDSFILLCRQTPSAKSVSIDQVIIGIYFSEVPHKLWPNFIFHRLIAVVPLGVLYQ
ncbi:MAG: hypothetical protein RL189_3151 [Pseudomonadota bacterium]|jgi:hypothetical protein